MTTVYQRFIADVEAEPLTVDQRLSLARQVMAMRGVQDGRYALLRDWAQQELARHDNPGRAEP